MLVEFDWPLSMMPIVFPSSESKPAIRGRSLGFSVALGSRNLMVATNLRLLARQFACVHEFYIRKTFPAANATTDSGPEKWPLTCVYRLLLIISSDLIT